MSPLEHISGRPTLELVQRAATTRDYEEQLTLSQHESAVVHGALLRNPHLDPRIREFLDSTTDDSAPLVTDNPELRNLLTDLFGKEE